MYPTNSRVSVDLQYNCSRRGSRNELRGRRLMQSLLTSRRQFLAQGATLTAVGLTRLHAEQTNHVSVIDCHAHVGHAPALTDPWTTVGDPEEILKRNREA